VIITHFIVHGEFEPIIIYIQEWRYTKWDS